MAKEYLTENPGSTIDSTIEHLNADKVLIVTDTNVDNLVLPLLSESKIIKESPKIVIPAGEQGKNLDTVVKVWEKLEDIGATRRSVIINIGGGVVTDLGGFAASAYKRGIRTVNFPTTLLGAVDAATGGKTGIDFKGLKNEIGAFHLPSKVIISAKPFKTLPKEEVLSGYAEMIKTALISDADFYFELLEMEDLLEDENKLGRAVEKCVMIKDEIVEQDPKEQGLRKILNFGHTAGHAFESLRIEKGLEITHGKAVAHGMLVALILSHLKLGFDSKEVNRYAGFLKNYYGGAMVRCEDLDAVIEKMNRDKKNKRYGEPLFTLLKNIGEPEIDYLPSQQDIRESLELYQDFVS